MLPLILEVRQQVLDGKRINREQAVQLSACSRAMIPYICAVANEVRLHFRGDRIELCALTNARSGNCSEDCAFCAQSAHHSTQINQYPLISAEEILEQAKIAENRGADEFCIVTSGKGQENSKDFEIILEAIRLIRAHTSLRVGTSLGFMSPEQMRALKEAGVFRNNHNLETCREHFGNVVGTHTYDMRQDHVKEIIRTGINACCGGIIGLGETPEQRLNLAFEVSELDVECVPINILNPVSGSRLQNQSALEPMEILKTIALFRLINPQSTIKIAGGRQDKLRELQAAALLSGANGIILGNYLTQPGRDWKTDLQMISDIGCTCCN